MFALTQARFLEQVQECATMCITSQVLGSVSRYTDTPKVNTRKNCLYCVRAFLSCVLLTGGQGIVH